MCEHDLLIPGSGSHSVLLFSEEVHELALSFKTSVISGLHLAKFLNLSLDVLEAWALLPSLSVRPGHSSCFDGSCIQLLWIYKYVILCGLLGFFEMSCSIPPSPDT